MVTLAEQRNGAGGISIFIPQPEMTMPNSPGLRHATVVDIFHGVNKLQPMVGGGWQLLSHDND